MYNFILTLNYRRAIACFFMAYLLVSIFATAFSVFYEIIYQTDPVPAGDSILNAPSFVATVPYHVLIMLVIWPISALVYFGRKKKKQFLHETLALSVFWLLAAMVVDLIFFVLIKHPYSLSFYEFYVVYQPWITLIYLAIFISPFTYWFFVTIMNNQHGAT